MSWSPEAGRGPRMELFFYNLCSKAGYSNMSVVPAASDTCELLSPGQVVGFGAVETVDAAAYGGDCCAACLSRSWCLAWEEQQQPEQLSSGTLCALRDNTLPQPAPAPPAPLGPGAYKPHSGCCGGTDWAKSAAACNTSASGAVRAREHGITTFAQCEAFCRRCARCAFVSFSQGVDPSDPQREDHDDCSWYDHGRCDLGHLLNNTARYTSAAVRKPPTPAPSTPRCGVRRARPAQQLPSPRYANCIVNGAQAIRSADNEAGVPAGSDAEWAAVSKEQALAEKCAVPPPPLPPPPLSPSPGPPPPPPPTASYFWTVMSQNGNAPASLGSAGECLPYCYDGADRAAPYPPVVNASSARCAAAGRVASGRAPAGARAPRALGFNALPMNQPKAMVALTAGGDPLLAGSFNWTFELELDLGVGERAFPANASLGVWSWRYDAARRGGVVRLYQRVSRRYPWVCTYFGVDSARGVKGNQLYDGRGMLVRDVFADQDVVVRFFLNITRDQIGGGGGVGSWYLLNSEACWDQVTGRNCRPYGDTNRMSHQQVLLDYGGGDACTQHSRGGCPLYHLYRNGSRVRRDDARFPHTAYKFYCCPCTVCAACAALGLGCCDPLSNPNGQSIYKIAPDAEWAPLGFPANASDGFVGNAKEHELHVGKLWQQMWFACPASEPPRFVTFNIGPETGYGTGTHDTEFFVAGFDVLVPDK
eukprot:g3702.t1